MFLSLFSRKGRLARAKAADLYKQVVHHSRSPIFYTGYNVPDTFEGRFGMIAMHGGLVVNRLCRPDMGKDGQILAQAFFDVMFLSLDWSIREMGVGDLGVPRRIKKMMSSFKGLAFAYDKAVRAGAGEIQHVLLRNVYAEAEKPSAEMLTAMADYISQCANELEQQGLDSFWQGQVSFPHIKDNTQGHVSHAA